eukprot:CAMPEP_0197526164 /NCGR_PEP_ID=MMETSP1318-20131121/16417_1 /TAXON_ID=552666 /ORGANISM="Partenskyella glossopodia, Strain RCC365" /LENGTH=341 /DNA_ID=CAMNT_0043080185 /DNA_START=49 /DNA_END=1074 /DNA_ORIENTATION=+
MMQDTNGYKGRDDVLPDAGPVSARRRKESVGLIYIILGIACFEAAETAEASTQTSGPSCNTLTPNQTAQFNVYQCRAIQQPCFASMKPKAFSGFTAECVAGFDGNAIQGITANQIGRIKPKAFMGWNSNIEYMGLACAGMTAAQTSYFQEYACGAFGQDCFTAMDSSAYSGFSKKCVANWRDNELGASLGSRDLAKLSPDAVAGLNDHDVALWTQQCEGFGAHQLASISELACEGMSSDCLEYIPPKSCSGFVKSSSGLCQGLYNPCMEGKNKQNEQIQLFLAVDGDEGPSSSFVQPPGQGLGLAHLPIIFVVSLVGMFTIAFAGMYSARIAYLRAKYTSL